LGWTNVSESHPFTIASGDEEEVRLVVKVAGDWTRRVHEVASATHSCSGSGSSSPGKGDIGERECKGEERSMSGVRVRCLIEGPYGQSFSLI
jgi:hypothetical protein